MSKTTLTITTPDGTVAPYDLHLPAITLGSGMQNLVIIPHESVAEQHAELSLDVTGYLITDLVGDGATLMNGYPLEKGMSYQLENGVQLQLGEVLATYSVEVPVAPEPEPVPVEVDFPEPGSFPRPAHPAGMFVPLKKKSNPALILAMVIAGLAVAGAALIGLMTSEISVPH